MPCMEVVKVWFIMTIMLGRTKRLGVITVAKPGEEAQEVLMCLFSCPQAKISLSPQWMVLRDQNIFHHWKNVNFFQEMRVH